MKAITTSDLALELAGEWADKEEARARLINFASSMVPFDLKAGRYPPTVTMMLTFKPSIPDDVLDEYDRLVPLELPAAERKRRAITAPNRTRNRTFLKRSIKSEELHHALGKVNRRLGTAYRRGKKVLGCTFWHEGNGVDKLMHMHGWIEIPPGMGPARFIAVIRAAWSESIWALPINRIEVTRNHIASSTYMSKGGLENLDVALTRRSTTLVG